jgi:hypothetical protein
MNDAQVAHSLGAFRTMTLLTPSFFYIRRKEVKRTYESTRMRKLCECRTGIKDRIPESEAQLA